MKYLKAREVHLSTEEYDASQSHVTVEVAPHNRKTWKQFGDIPLLVVFLFLDWARFCSQVTKNVFY